MAKSNKSSNDRKSSKKKDARGGSSCLLKEKIAEDGIRVTKMAHQLDSMAKTRLGGK